MAAYTAAVVWALYAAGAWTFDLLKDTIFWFVLSGLAVAFSVVLAATDGSIWRRVVVDQLKVVVVLEYIVNTYAFSFPVELVLVPVLTFLAMLDVIARSDVKHAQVVRLTGGLQALFGFGVLAVATAQAIAHLDAVQTADVLRSLLLAPTLSVLFVPFIYLLILVTTYESLLVRLKLGLPKDPGVKWYARRRLICHLGLRPQKIRTFMCAHAWDLTRIRTKADIDTLLTLDDPAGRRSSGASALTDTIVYFAYGSNMLSRRLRTPDRAPSAVAVGTGFVQGRRLTFDKVSSDGSGKCDIEDTGNPSDRAYGVVFKIGAAEKPNLDRAEGLGRGYREELVKVVTSEGTSDAVTYVATAKEPALRPYHWYKALVVAGAVEHCLPSDYIEWLRTIHSQPDPNAQRCAQNESLLFGR